jgi:hypothetical protein
MVVRKKNIILLYPLCTTARCGPGRGRRRTTEEYGIGNTEEEEFNTTTKQQPSSRYR